MGNREQQRQFEALWREHQGVAHKVAGMYARNREDRLDLVQEIGIQLWRSFPRYDAGRARFSTWLYRIALNVAISQSRRKGRRVERHCDSLEPWHLEHPGEPENLAADNEARLAALHALIDSLGPLDRALMLLYLEDRSHAEMAEVLGISTGNVATKIHRIKHKLRGQMAARPSPEHEHGTR